MDHLPIYEIPWNLVAASLRQELSAEEALQLQQWLSADKANQEKYDQLFRLWNTGLEDYSVFQSANETDAWHTLYKSIEKNNQSAEKETPVIRGNFEWLSGRNLRIAVAVIFVLVIGTLFWYEGRDSKQLHYETAKNQQKNIILPDGSTLLLKESSDVWIDGNYNKQNRSVNLSKGEAFFTVIHLPQLPFIVNMGSSSVRDIGTTFSIHKTRDSIKVTVTDGKVAFIKNETKETRELSAGMALSFTLSSLKFGEIESIEQQKTVDSSQLHFTNAPLPEVIAILEKVYNRKIELLNGQLAQKKFTADLKGHTFDFALQVICSSLNLTYTEKNGIYLLKEK